MQTDETTTIKKWDNLTLDGHLDEDKVKWIAGLDESGFEALTQLFEMYLSVEVRREVDFSPCSHFSNKLSLVSRKDWLLRRTFDSAKTTYESLLSDYRRINCPPQETHVWYCSFCEKDLSDNPVSHILQKHSEGFKAWKEQEFLKK